MNCFNLFLLTLVLAVSSTQSQQLTAVVNAIPTPGYPLPTCTSSFATAFASALTGWLQWSVNFRLPDTTIGAFNMTAVGLNRRLNENGQESDEIDAHRTLVAGDAAYIVTSDGQERHLTSYPTSCGTCSSGTSCFIMCAPVSCTTCLTSSYISSQDYYDYLTRTVNSQGVNYVYDPNTPDGGCMGNTSQLVFQVALVAI